MRLTLCLSSHKYVHIELHYFLVLRGETNVCAVLSGKRFPPSPRGGIYLAGNITGFSSLHSAMPLVRNTIHFLKEE